MMRTYEIKFGGQIWSVSGEFTPSESSSPTSPGYGFDFEIETVRMLVEIPEDLGGEEGEIRVIRVDTTELAEDADFLDYLQELVIEHIEDEERDGEDCDADS